MMSNTMEKWKHERLRTSTSQHNQLRENETRSLFRNEREVLQSNKSANLSESLDAISKQVQESREKRLLLEKERDELSNLCARQAENIAECRQAILRSSTRLSDDVKLRDTFSVKYQKTFQMIHKLYCNSKCVTDCLHKVDAIRETVGPLIKEAKTKSEKMTLFMNETISVTLPSYQYSSSLLCEEQKKLADDTVAAQNFVTSLQQKHANQKEPKIDQYNRDIKYINELKFKIQDSKNMLDDLSRQYEDTIREKNEKKLSLEREVNSVIENCITVDNDLLNTCKELEGKSLQVQILQNKLSDSEKRKDQLLFDKEQLMKNTKEVEEFLVHEKAAQSDTESKLKFGKEAFMSFKAEMELIRGQLLKEKDNGDQELKSLEDDLSQVETKFSQKRQSLQGALDAAKLKESDALHEEVELQNHFIQLQNKLETITTNNIEDVQSNGSIENDLTSTLCELQQLTKEVEEKSRSVSDEKGRNQKLEDSLTASKQKLEELLSELNTNLTMLTEEEICAVTELSIVDREAQDLNHKIQVLQKDMEESHSLTAKQLSCKINESEEKIVKLKGDLASKNEMKEVITNAHQQELELLKGNMLQIKELMVKLQSSISVKDQEINGIEITMKKNIEAREESKGIIEECKQDISRYSEMFQDNSKKEEVIMLKLEKMDTNLKNIDQSIVKLQLALTGREANIASITDDHDKKKQIWLQNLLQYQSTTEHCAEEINLLKKKLISWNEKIDATHKNSEKVTIEMASLTSKMLNSKEEVEILVKKSEEYKEKALTLTKEIQQAEEEASEVKKKYTRIQAKVDAHVAEKKKKQLLQTTNDNIDEDTTKSVTVQGVVTPQFNSTSGVSGDYRKEETPKSILKTPSKSPTPQSSKRVKFVVDENDPPSSGSTIVMGSDLANEMEAANAEDRSQILKKYAERQRADKRKFEAGPSTFKVPIPTLQPDLKSTNDNRHDVHHDDDDNSSTSTIIMNDFAEELERNPGFIYSLKTKHAELRAAKRMRMSYPPSTHSNMDPITPGVNEITSSTPETDLDPTFL